AWLAVNRPSPDEMAAEPSVSTGHAPGWARRWTRTMFDAGWLVPGWPPERGGRNARPIETLVYLEELARARVPRTTNVQGLGIVAPSILDYGTLEQVERYAMPILRGEATACLGMSEPGAGSDLASLSTRAVRDGDEWVINGQKVWTSGANHADFCFLFCRTNPEAPKHKGISIVLVPMDTPGITVRPLPEIVHPQHPDLNEVFLDDVRVPAENLVGELDNGWAMANGSLAHERGMVWVSAVMGLEESLARLLDEAPAALDRLPAGERALAVDQIVRMAIDTQAARCLGYRGFAKLARGGTAPEQALMKLFASEARQRVALVATEVHGADALEVGTVEMDGHLAVDEPQGSWAEQYLHSFANTISAGSSEIQRNIIAERVLGLPRG
ncbi:MAG TPA: acyl-CoA dehydrogenase family protein, partial [Acidimicrobiales bacterium]|nr:acyl-CoA dehydrogenase family protein [Acidimicrobiales bacterium]